MQVRIVANPVAGGGRGRAMAEALAFALEARGESVDLSFTSKAGDARQSAERGGVDCMVAVGGDGSVNEIVNGLTDLGVPLAILPMGTANVVARELNIPNNPETVAELIVKGHMRQMDVGLYGHQRFLLGAGAGLDAAIAKEVSQQRGARSGLSKWVWPSIKTSIAYQFPKIRVIVDGEEVSDDTQYAIVGNCRFSAGIFPATPKAKIDDGLLDICLFRRLGAIRLLVLTATIWRARFIEHEDVTYLQARHVELQEASKETVPLQVDGDPAGALPGTFQLNEIPISVVCPPK